MRFQRKRLAVIGGILAAFVLSVGVLVGVTNKKEDASAISSTATISNDGWTGSLNGWKTKYFKMTIGDPAMNRKRAWCGDLAGVSPNGEYTLKTITVNNDSSEKEKNLFKVMYYGESWGYSDVAIHETIHSVINEDSIMSSSSLYINAIASELPKKNNLTIYYTDPNDWGLSNHGRQTAYWQRIFTYSYEDRQEMELEIVKQWYDQLDSRYQDISYKGTNEDYYPDFIAVTVERTDGNPILNADGTQNVTLTNSNHDYIKLYREYDYKTSFSGLQAGQEFRITEDFAESGMEQDDSAGTWSYGDSPVEYENAQNTSCELISDYKIRCTASNKQAEYHDTRLYLNKVWDDRGYEELRSDAYRFKIKAFAGDTDVTDQIANGKLNSFVYIVKVGSNSYKGSGYVSELLAQLNGVEVKYYVAEIGLPEDVFSSTCETEKKTIDGIEYCLATKRNSNDGREDLEVTYTNAPEFVNKTVTKTWNDARGAIYARPTILFFDVYRNDRDDEPYAETAIWNPCYSGFSSIDSCSDEDEWKLDDLELPKYYKTASGDYAIATYTVVEKDYDWNNAGAKLSKKYVIENNGLTVTNTAKINIPVKKCWLDKDETKRPEYMLFNLYRKGSDEIVDTIRLTSDSEDEEGCWNGSFEDLPAYINGQIVEYEVEEDASEIEDYKYDEVDICSVNLNERIAAKGDDEELDTSCNFTNVELIDIPVIKVWEEDSKEDRPGSIEVSLLCGDDVLDTVTLSEENNLDGDNTWEYTWKNRRVDECEQGYSVAENINIPGYSTKISGNAEDGFVITNTKTLDDILKWGGLGAGSFGVIAAGFLVIKRKLFAR